MKSETSCGVPDEKCAMQHSTTENYLCDEERLIVMEL